MRNTPTLSDDPGKPAYIDIGSLIAGRLLIQAASGGGKSRTIRRLLEQTHGYCQHVVIDVEGEFHTLREQYDYILAGKDGEAPADLTSAPMLARTLLELGVSAIVDIYELGEKREAFVAKFLHAFVNAPRELWHPCLVIVDEASTLCPEGSKSDCARAVRDLMTLGRKRGFAGVLATQRIAPLDKTAAAQCQNKLVGLTTLDIDIDRAVRELGIAHKKSIGPMLKTLRPGQFFVQGPAFQIDRAGGEELVQIGNVRTTHPTAGQPSPPPTPTPATIKKMLNRLREIPAEAAAEEQTVAALRTRVAELERQLKDVAATRTQTKYDEMERTARELEQRVATLQRERDALMHQRDNLGAKAAHFASALREEAEAFSAFVNEQRQNIDVVAAGPRKRGEASEHDGRHPKHASDRPRLDSAAVDAPTPATTANGLSKMERAILTALAQHPSGLTRKQVLVHTGYANSGSTVSALATLRKHAWIHGSGELAITSLGYKVLGSYTPLPTGEKLFEYVLASGKLAHMEAKILAAVRRFDRGRWAARKDILINCNYKSSGSTVSAFARLVTLGYLVPGSAGHVRAAEELYDP